MSEPLRETVTLGKVQFESTALNDSRPDAIVPRLATSDVTSSFWLTSSTAWIFPLIEVYALVSIETLSPDTPSRTPGAVGLERALTRSFANVSTNEITSPLLLA